MASAAPQTRQTPQEPEAREEDESYSQDSSQTSGAPSDTGAGRSETTGTIPIPLPTKKPRTYRFHDWALI
ncbi:hypothetical protein [Celeribacter indicus]|uniref:Uncharacterized protein n=1 Tax=Celeribacter indicus TaxID=1208324 RepID=A0A0B5DWD9_9RHOB|nr:hypothetical protein [Celeribacter indicus]AJE47364.1 hypothetical protein P73_2649 [Celeribacter indicus]SDW04615.1 hypothetical protein SAMN05443573_101207 [Celeribacter indicus]